MNQLKLLTVLYLFGKCFDTDVLFVHFTFLRILTHIEL